MAREISGIEAGQRKLNGIQTAGRELRNLSQPRFGIAEQLDVAVPMRDGKKLLADIFVPDGGGRHPALLAFSCYPRQIQNTRIPLGMVEAGASDFFVPRGYVHLIANARGTGGSEGTWTLLDSKERDDLFDLIEWIAAQPFCDGNVGMVGISYFAMAQIAAATVKPKALKAIMPLGTNESVYDVAWHHGLLASSFLSPWISAVAALSAKTNELWRSRKMELLRAVFESPLVHSRMATVNGEALVTLLKKVSTAQVSDDFANVWQEAAVEHTTYDAYWADRDSKAALGSVEIPVYLGCDWENVIMHTPGTFTSWKALAKNPNVRMSLLPEMGLNWPWESLHYETLAWYDQWLKGIDTGILEGDPVRYYMPVAGEWRTAKAWPPPESKLVELALRADGALATDEGTPGSRDYLFLTQEVGRPEHASPPALPDSLQWELPVSGQPLELAGDIELRLDAAITALDTGWIATLSDVASDGKAVPITAGWLRAALRKVDEAASVPGAPVVRCAEPLLVPPGEKVTYRIPIVPNARRILPGRKLRLTLASSDLGKDAPVILGFRHTPAGEATRNTVFSSSRLLLPVLEG